MRTPEVILAEMDALFPEPPDLSILGDPNVPIEEQKARFEEARKAHEVRWSFFGVPEKPNGESESNKETPEQSPIKQYIEEIDNYGEAAIPSLLGTLTHTKSMMRFVAAMGLMAIIGQNQKEKEEKPYIPLIADILLERLAIEKDGQALMSIIALLGTLKEPRAVEPLIAFVKAPIISKSDRLVTLTPLDGMIEMRRTLEGNIFFPRDAAVESLGQIGDRRATPSLIRLMDTDLSEELGGLFSHRNAAEILVEWGVREAIKPIQRCLARYQESTSESVQRSNQYVCPHLETALHKLETQAEGIV
jgi:HEAT repeat protein